MSNWISVKDRLPEQLQRADWWIVPNKKLTGTDDPNLIFPMRVTNRYFGQWDRCLVATHWMPLPEPPQENNDE